MSTTVPNLQPVIEAFKKFGEAALRAARIINKAFMRLGRYVVDTLAKMNRAYVERVNNEVRVSGLEARFYVRGALACNTIDEVVVLVKMLMQEPERENMWLRLLTRENRGRLAASAIRGHVEHNKAVAA